jgi:hypothetical protein
LQNGSETTLDPAREPASDEAGWFALTPYC